MYKDIRVKKEKIQLNPPPQPCQPYVYEDAFSGMEVGAPTQASEHGEQKIITAVDVQVESCETVEQNKPSDDVKCDFLQDSRELGEHEEPTADIEVDSSSKPEG